MIRVASEGSIDVLVATLSPRVMAERYYILQVSLSLIGTIWYGIIWSIGLLGCWTA
jgi:hypothetical protein